MFKKNLTSEVMDAVRGQKIPEEVTKFPCTCKKYVHLKMWVNFNDAGLLYDSFFMPSWVTIAKICMKLKSHDGFLKATSPSNPALFLYGLDQGVYREETQWAL